MEVPHQKWWDWGFGNSPALVVEVFGVGSIGMPKHNPVKRIRTFVRAFVPSSGASAAGIDLI